MNLPTITASDAERRRLAERLDEIVGILARSDSTVVRRPGRAFLVEIPYGPTKDAKRPFGRHGGRVELRGRTCTLRVDVIPSDWTGRKARLRIDLPCRDDDRPLADLGDAIAKLATLRETVLREPPPSDARHEAKVRLSRVLRAWIDHDAPEAQGRAYAALPGPWSSWLHVSTLLMHATRACTHAAWYQAEAAREGGAGSIHRALVAEFDALPGPHGWLRAREIGALDQRETYEILPDAHLDAACDLTPLESMRIIAEWTAAHDGPALLDGGYVPEWS